MMVKLRGFTQSPSLVVKTVIAVGSFLPKPNRAEGDIRIRFCYTVKLVSANAAHHSWITN